jgi:hypothetical protein
MLAALGAALSAGLSGAAFAVGWTVTLGNGQALNIVEGATATRSGYFLERRYPDGARDPQFGSGGRSFFTMGSDNSPPSTIQVDTAGRILVSGAAPGLGSRTAAAVLRFLPGGQVDASWGQQGRSLAMAADGDATAVDVLPFVDGSVFVLGAIEDQRTQRVALWRFGSNGQLDTSFANGGTLVANSLPQSQGLSIQQASDGALFIAVQTGSADKPWLEVHRWATGDPGPMRIARQEFPEDWVGPAQLTARGANWIWLDASQPLTPPLPLTPAAPASVWTNATVALAAPRPAEAASTSGHAALNPFSQDALGTTGFAALTLDDLAWPGMLVLTLAVLGGGLWWWWRRE